MSCLFFNPHVWYVGLATCIASLFLLISQYICSRKVAPELQISIKSFSKVCIKDFIISGIWNSLNNLGNMLNSGLDLLITNKLLTEIIMGVVSVGKTLGSLCYSLVIAISNSYRPKQLECYSRKEIDKLVKLLKRSMKITGSVCAIILSGFIVCGHSFLMLWLRDQDIDFLYRISIIVLLSDIMIGVVNPLYYVFTLTKKLKVPCIITISMGFMNVISMYCLIKYTSLGAYAVVLTTMVLNFVHFIDTPIYSSYCLKVPYNTFYPTILRHLLNCAICTLSMFFISYLLPSVDSWRILILHILIYSFIGSIMSICINSDNDDRDMIYKKVQEHFHQ